MENFAWIENQLVQRGFIKTYSESDAIEFEYPYKNGDSSYVLIWLKGEGGPNYSINHNLINPNRQGSERMPLPQTIKELMDSLLEYGVLLPTEG